MTKDINETITGLIDGEMFSLDLAPAQPDGVMSTIALQAIPYPTDQITAGYITDNSREETKIILAARIAHEINRAYCAFLGDGSQEPWDKAPEWQRESIIAGMRAHFANPDMTARDSHNAWCDHKFAEGWRYGPVKDADAKEHPCMVPYRELPSDQRLKDHLFKAVATAMRNASL